MTKQISSDEGQSLDFLLDSYLDIGLPTVGEIRDGYVVALINNQLLVDIGAKSEGIINSSEVGQMTKVQLDELSEGSQVRVCIVEPEDDNGNIIVSYLKVAQAEEWQRVNEFQEQNKTGECTITGCNRGGLLASFGTLRGFIPISQLSPRHQINRRNASDEQLRELIGKTLTIKILDAIPDQNRLILSEIEAEKSERKANRTERFAEIELGQTYEGTVINITNFGAFVDIGQIEGLVHLTELSWQHVDHPSDILSVGQKVKVVIKEIDKAKQRLNFSIKQLEENPWEHAGKIYEIGSRVEVSVTQLTRYGAFARINDKYALEGLIHISELSDEHIESPSEVINKGDTVFVRIIRIDVVEKQIAFSLKQIDAVEVKAAEVAPVQQQEESNASVS